VPPDAQKTDHRSRCAQSSVEYETCGRHRVRDIPSTKKPVLVPASSKGCWEGSEGGHAVRTRAPPFPFHKMDAEALTRGRAGVGVGLHGNVSSTQSAVFTPNTVRGPCKQALSMIRSVKPRPKLDPFGLYFPGSSLHYVRRPFFKQILFDPAPLPSAAPLREIWRIYRAPE